MPTFLFTDIENSTKLWDKYGEAMAAALARHDDILGEEVPRYGGRIVKHTGDGVFAVFEGEGAAAAALAVQRRLAEEDWGPLGELRVRMALHRGDAERRQNDYFGPAVNRAHRLLEVGWGGQLLLTAEVVEAGLLPPGATAQDLGVHLLKDLGVPQRIYQLVSPELRQQEFPPLRSLSSRPHNLPPQPTPFIGREKELAEVTALVAEPATRLVTLLGPGGIGKTRLALQVGAEVMDDFEWGVYFVPLAPIKSPEYLVSAIAGALNFSFATREKAQTQLLNFLGQKTLLLVMDNFEHIAAGAVLLADIVAGAPNIKVIVTSRERLNLRAERVYEIKGMTYPSSPTAASWEGFSAVKLFIECARRVQPSFAPSAADVPALVDICRAVEGLPLAIELATAWLKTLSVQEVAAELGRGLDFFESSAADLPERHRSLKAVFEYSYGLLNDRERRAVAALSVFRGGFTRDAAREVADARLAVLSALVDKSLVRPSADGRFELHELIRQYAQAKLEGDADARDEVGGRHAAYYLAFLTARREALAGFRQREALAEIAAEIDNVRAAWEWAVARGDARAIGDASEPLFAFYRMRGSFEEGRGAFARALAAFGPRARAPGVEDRTLSVTHAKLLVGKGNFDAQMASYEVAVPTLREAVAASRRLGAMREVVVALNALAAAAFYRGAIARSRRISEGSLGVSEKMGDRSEVVPALLNLAFCAKAEGDYVGAKEYYSRALKTAQALGDQNRVAIILNNTGNIERALGNLARAQELLEYSLSAGREIGNMRLVSFSLNNLGNIAEQRGDVEKARRYFEESLKIKEELNDRRLMPETLANLAGALAGLGDYEGALARCAQGVAVARELGLEQKVIHCQERMGYTLLAKGDYRESREAFAEGLRTAFARDDLSGAAEIFVGIGYLWARTNEAERAVEALAALAARPPIPPLAAAASEALAEIREHMGAGAYDAAAARGRKKDWKELAAAFIAAG